MTEQETREKIVGIITHEYVTDKDYAYIFDPRIEEKINNMADALIAAGIGDVGETKEKLKKINERILLGDIIACDLSAKCAEYKYRAEVAEKMFNILYEETSEYMKVLSKEWYKYQAEKELAEERKDD